MSETHRIGTALGDFTVRLLPWSVIKALFRRYRNSDGLIVEWRIIASTDHRYRVGEVVECDRSFYRHYDMDK